MMRRLLRADGFRMIHSRELWFCIAGMLLTAAGFIFMQYTAMDYEVPLSRVIFLPMSFFGVAVAALVSLYVGQDFSDGCIRNKIIAGRSRKHIYFSCIVVSCIACAAVFLITTLFTVVVGRHLFSQDVGAPEITQYLVLGLFMSMADGCIFSAVTLLNGNKTTAVMSNMFLAFFMLFLCMHTNQILVQPEFKDGILNPHYASGIKRQIYGILHDLNPFGQAAQLSSMNCLNTVRFIFCDFIWGIITVGCSRIFGKKNIR